MPHTPGPWTVQRPNGPARHASVNAGETWIAQVIYNGTTAPSVDANAQAIAAVPALIDACQYLAQMAMPQGCYGESIRYARKLARDALALAGG